MNDWKQGTVYLRRTDRNKKVTHTEHACWQTERFIESESDAAKKESGSIEVITKEEYSNR